MAIAFRQVATSTGNNAAIPTGTVAGDVMIGVAYRGGNTTPPSLPAGWTSVTTVASSDCSMRVAWRAWQSGDTAPTWTNATQTAILSYSGADTADPIGSFDTSNADSNTVTIPALALQDTSGASWVVAGYGHERTTSLSTPSGMTERFDVDDGQPQCAGSDTNAGVASWSGSSSSATDTRQCVAVVLELLEGALSVNVGQATETDTALAISKVLDKPVGLPTETNTAQSITAVRTLAVAATTETDTALSITSDIAARNIDVGLATEADTALTVGKIIDKPVGLASEADTAVGITVFQALQVNTAFETDTALDIIFKGEVDVQVGEAVETDDAPNIVLSVFTPLFTFQMPRYEVGHSPKAPAPFKYFGRLVADSLIRVNGALVQVHTPAHDQLVGEEGKDWFMGGRIYRVPPVVKAELEAAGYIVEED